MGDGSDGVQLVCPSEKWGTAIKATGLYRVRCRGKFCRGPDGTVTFHTFDLATGRIVRTDVVAYRDPRALLGGEQCRMESSHSGAAIARSSR
jgi:hypothetical protein